MNIASDIIFGKYDKNDWLLYRKARTLFILNAIVILLLLIECTVSSLVLGGIAPETLPNLIIGAGLAFINVLVVRGRYHIASALGVMTMLLGITWTRVASTGQFSPDASYDFLQYVLDLILVVFYANLIADHKNIVLAAFICGVLFLSVYTYLLPVLFHNPVTSTTVSVFISGFLFLIIGGLINSFTFLQNRRAIEIAVQESTANRVAERNYREIFNSTNEAIFIHEAETGRLIDVNDAMLKMYGFDTKEDALAHSIGDLSSDARQFDSTMALRNLMKAQMEGPQTFEWLAKKLTGEEFWVEVSLHRSQIGGHGRVLAVVRDISGRKRAEEALQTSEEVFYKLITSIPDVIIRTDLEGNIVFVNETGLPSLGYANTDRILGKNIFSFVSEQDKARAKENAIKMYAGFSGPREYVLVGDRGNMVECEVNGDVLRGNDGLPFGMVYIIRDMTDKKKLQAQLLQSQKMEAIGRLAGGVAHDYNNMLGVILGYATLLAAEIPAGMPAQSKVKSIIAAAERSADLTKQLLAFSRQQIIAPIVLNLHDELLALNRMVGRLIGEDVTLSVNRHGALWNTKIDPTQFTQLITNLAANARDAIVNTGTITIDLKNVRITKPREAGYGDVPPGEYVLLSFSDSGCGMDEATVQQIFEPFFTTKPPGKGTGLGLATVFGIVTQNDGYINVSSRIGEGTTFDVYFPRVTADAALPAAAAEEADLRGTETIIVVEDEKELLALTMNTLQVQGYTVIGACDSAEALSLVDHFTGRVDILVTDVIMPGMNGKELKERLEMRYPSIKTLFISGYTSDIVANRGVLGEGMDFLQKPFSAPGLLTKIRQMANAT